jgi:hypothetical protein
MTHMTQVAGALATTVALLLTSVPAQAAGTTPEPAGDGSTARLLIPSLDGVDMSMQPEHPGHRVSGEVDRLSLSGGAGAGVPRGGGGAGPSAIQATVTLELDQTASIDFRLRVDGATTGLGVDHRGAAVVTSADGALVNRIAPPIATDVAGAEVPARWDVDGEQLVLSIGRASHPGPISVLASLECNVGFCTSVMSRAETRAVANGDYAVAMSIVALACGPAAGFCGLAMTALTRQAKAARSKGVCVGIRKTNVSAVAWIVHERCRR